MRPLQLPRAARWALMGMLAGGLGGCRRGDAGPPEDAGVGSDAALLDGDAGVDDPDPLLSDAERRALATLAPSPLPPAPPDRTNEVADDDAAAAFGRRLFFDPRFSGALTDHDNDGMPGSLGVVGDTGKVACASCHVPPRGFSDSRSGEGAISLGAGWGRRRAPSLLDVGQTKLVMWDGRRDALWNQLFGPVESFVEMNSSRLFVAQRIYENHRPEYERIFGPLPDLSNTTRFPSLTASQTGCRPSKDTSSLVCDGTTHGVPGDGAEYDRMAVADQIAVTRVVVNMGKAIEAYERRLTCGAGAFDAWMHGDATAMPRAAQRGAALFVGKAGCVKCHDGPYFSDHAFHNVGLAPARVQSLSFVDADDHGARDGLRAALADPLGTAGAFSDMPGGDGRLPTAIGDGFDGAFRTPTLRCVSKRTSFMHTGQLRRLDGALGVVAFFNRGGDTPIGAPTAIGANELHSLGLSLRETADVVSFLQALDGPGPAIELLTPEAP